MSLRTRLVLHSVVLALVACIQLTQGASAGYVNPDDMQQLATERAIAWGAPVSRVREIIRCETGGKWSPFYANGTLLVGSHGELGMGQWLRGGAWYQTKHYREWGLDIRLMYQTGDPDAPFWDIDGLAYAQSPQAPRGLASQWSC